MCNCENCKSVVDGFMLESVTSTCIIFKSVNNGDSCSIKFINIPERTNFLAGIIYPFDTLLQFI